MKVEAHTQYKGDNGQDFPGVTTVLNVLDKPGLPKWANNLGLKGIDSNRFTSEAAEIGTLAHEMVMCHFAGRKCDVSDYSMNQVKRAELSLDLFHRWEKIYKPRPIFVEKYLVSHRFGYGGTLDLFATIEVAGRDFVELIDFKTGKGPYPSHYAQLAAYRWLLMENGHAPENCRLLQIPADPSKDSFAEHQMLKLDRYWMLFLHCLAIYKMRIL